MDDDINYLDVLKDLKENYDKYMYIFAKYIFSRNNHNLSHYQQLDIDKTIRENPKTYKTYKIYIKNKNILNKYKHLEDAKNFDLV
jgi:hypothetical protein